MEMNMVVTVPNDYGNFDGEDAKFDAYFVNGVSHVSALKHYSVVSAHHFDKSEMLQMSFIANLKNVSGILPNNGIGYSTDSQLAQAFQISIFYMVAVQTTS
ncbi:hypothetical protein KIN20_003004 [Parelaphostrongylus tenuis]|uniref:Uncharacterized protein n=1 Tax=Parelaphostrongylus tenuis TaxID=148309 RepID=A0AAD5M0N4_PARTN|nr:hypothetical protein KIN20_003004 [Parelaphostrongylus tenuis]